MARFNLEDYDLVENRIRKFYELHPDGRLITELVSATDLGNGKTKWVVKSFAFLNGEDHALDLPKATGFAFEIDGGGGANATSALENCETSSLGRCLANMNLSGNKRASREEMRKVVDAAPSISEPVDERVWLERIAATSTVEALRTLYTEARAAGAGDSVLVPIQDKAAALAG